jgi:hypothetical protein
MHHGFHSSTSDVFCFFLWNWRGRSPYRKTLLKQTIRKIQGSNSRDQERDKKNQKKTASYTRFCVHCSKEMEFLDLTLCTNNKISLRKKPLAVPISGGIPLKIKSFLAVQIVQHIRITANMKNWDWSLVLKWSTISGKVL